METKTVRKTYRWPLISVTKYMEDKEIPVETKIAVGKEIFRFVWRVALVLGPMLAALGVYLETRFEDHLVQRDAQMMDSLRIELLAGFDAMNRYEFLAAQDQDSILAMKFIESIFIPAKDSLLAIGANVVILQDRMDVVSEALTDLELEFNEFGRQKRSKAEIELAYYKTKAQNDETDRRLDEKLLQLERSRETELESKMDEVLELMKQRYKPKDRAR